MLDLIQLLFVSAAAGSWPAALVLAISIPISAPFIAMVALVVAFLAFVAVMVPLVAVGLALWAVIERHWA